MNAAHWLLATHLLGAMVWVGGIVFVFSVLRPSLAVLDVPARLVMNAEIHRRFFRVLWHVMPIVLASGYGMLFLVSGGFGAAGWAVHVMHLSGLAMSGLFLAIFFGPFRALRAAARSGNLAQGTAAMTRLRQLALLNLFLGMITMVIAVLGV
jgi:uncharacterized membrane protein